MGIIILLLMYTSGSWGLERLSNFSIDIARKWLNQDLNLDHLALQPSFLDPTLYCLSAWGACVCADLCKWSVHLFVHSFIHSFRNRLLSLVATTPRVWCCAPCTPLTLTVNCKVEGLFPQGHTAGKCRAGISNQVWSGWLQRLRCFPPVMLHQP